MRRKTRNRTTDPRIAEERNYHPSGFELLVTNPPFARLWAQGYQMNNKLIALLCLLTGTLAGFKIGRSTDPSSNAPAQTFKPPAEHSRGPTATGNDGASGSAPRGISAAISLDDTVAQIRAQLTGGFSPRHLSRLRELIYATPPSAYNALVSAMREDVKTERGYTLIRELMPRWGEHDPVAAVKFAQTFSNQSRRTHALSMALSGWSVSDLAGAKAYVASLRDDPKFDQLATGVITEMARRNPRDAFAFAGSIGLLQGKQHYLAVASIFHMWAIDDPQAASREMMKLDNPRQRDLVIPSVVHGMAQRDPQAVWEFALTLPLRDRQPIQRVILRTAGRQDPVTAARLADQLNPKQKAEAYGDIARVWAQEDLSAALGWAKDLPKGKSQENVFRSLGSDWANSEPRAMAAFIGELPPGKQHDVLSQSLATSWSKTDPHLALQWSAGLPSGQSRNNVTRKIIAELTKQDPAAAVAWISKESANPTQNGLYRTIASSWVQSDPDATMAWVKSLPPAGIEQAASDIIRDVSETDPAGAAGFIDSLPKTSTIYLTGTVVKNWVPADAKAAAAWADDMEEGMAKDNAFTALGDAWGKTDPASAAAFAMEQGDARLRDKLIGKVAIEWGASDSERAINWIETLDEGAGRELAIAGVMSGIAQYSPVTAAEQVAALPAGAAQEKAAEAVVASWSRADAPRAAEWVAEFPEGSTRKSALRLVVQNWANSDIEGVSEFMRTLPEGSSRTEAIKTLVSSGIYRNPAAVAPWVLELGTNRSNLYQIERLGQTWLRKDRDAAQKWLKSTPLSPDRLKRLLK
jgi:hypothetical protein